MADSETVEIVARAREGDDAAASALFERYVARLIDLAEARIFKKLGRRLDAEDIVQSVYRSFFLHLRQGRYELRASGDLWRLLATMAVRKVHRQARTHTAEKRAIYREDSVFARSDANWLQPDAFAREPSPDVVLEIIDELEHMYALRSPAQRQIVELRLRNYSIAEISRMARVSERTVHRVLADARKYLETRFYDGPAGSSEVGSSESGSNRTGSSET